MDEARLMEIEQRLAVLRPHADELGMRSIATDATDLLAEVRRLRQLSQDNDQAYSDGIDSGHADIVGIILDLREDNDPATILTEIKHFLGID